MTDGFGDKSDIPAGLVLCVPCAYCRTPISANGFLSSTSAGQLLSAVCPACERRVTLPAATWRRWSRPAAAAEQVAAGSYD